MNHVLCCCWLRLMLQKNICCRGVHTAILAYASNCSKPVNMEKNMCYSFQGAVSNTRTLVLPVKEVIKSLQLLFGFWHITSRSLTTASLWRQAWLKDIYCFSWCQKQGFITNHKFIYYSSIRKTRLYSSFCCSRLDRMVLISISSLV